MFGIPLNYSAVSVIHKQSGHLPAWHPAMFFL